MELYRVDIREVRPFAAALAERISAARREKMNFLRREEDRLRSLAGGALLRWRFGAADIAEGKYGKPALAAGPQFNLSHAGDHVVLAVSDAPVGVDVEKQVDDDLRTLAGTAFHPLEFAEWSETADVAGFFDMWTLKESYCKMTGRGLSLAPALFRVRREDGAYRVDGDETAAFRLYRDIPGYSLAVCVRPGIGNSDWPPVVTRVAPDELTAS